MAELVRDEKVNSVSFSKWSEFCNMDCQDGQLMN